MCPQDGWNFYSGRNKKMKIKVVLESAEEGGYTAYVPSLPGCISEGDTFDEAMKNIKEALELYLEPDEDELFDFQGAQIAEVAI
jgi:predicted RNase H-like HicB family nuclease